MAYPAMTSVKAALFRLLETASEEEAARALSVLTPTAPVLAEYPPPELVDVAVLSDKDFDIFKLAQRLGNLGTFMSVTCSLSRHYDMISTLRTDEGCFIRLMQAVGSGYRDNPYHNVLHAADVGHSVHLLVTIADLITSSEMPAVPLAALFLSAYIHDYGHPGVNNKYLVKTEHELAVRYNDISPLENYHLAQSFKLMQHSSFNILAALPAGDRTLLRSLMIRNVLATDMDQHQRLIEDAKRLSSDPSLRTNQSFIQPILVHFSDIANVMKPSTAMMQWGKWVNEEFFNQADLELKNHLEPSFSFTRETGDIIKNQKFFIEGLSLPLFEPMIAAWPSLNVLLEMIRENVRYLTLPSIA